MADDDDNSSEKSYESDTGTADFADLQTQILDSQFPESPTLSYGDKSGYDADQFHMLQSAVPFDDTVMFDDELETQVMDPGDETQVMDHGGETQMVGDETQVVNYGAEVQATQLCDDYATDEVGASDSEGTERTEVVDDTDEWSDGDSGKRDCANSTDLKNSHCMHLVEEDIKANKSKSGFGRKAFTSIRAASIRAAGLAARKGFTSSRAASIRAAGLAARNKALEKGENRSCSMPLKDPHVENKSIPFDIVEKYKQIDGPKTGNPCVLVRSAVRKLFAEDTFSKANEANNNVNFREGAKSSVSLNVETELAGLSYIDSQEPGEATQADALEFVDNFLKVNIECDDGSDIGKSSTGGKSKPDLSARGSRCFAKSANLVNAARERGIFDWDDSREDEGGGEFFRKNKEVFFANEGRGQKSSSCSKSGRKAKSLGTNVKVNESDKQSNLGFADGTTEVPTDIRFDTQMAAEAMEDLCFSVHGTGRDSNNNDIPKGGPIQSRKKPTLSNVGERTRQSKSTRTGNGSKEATAVLSRRSSTVRKQCDTVPVKESKGVQAAPQTKVTNNASKNPNKRRESDRIDSPVASTGEMSVKKQCVRLGNVTPVARRTRQSKRENVPDKDNDASSNIREEINLPTAYPRRKRTCQKASSARQEVRSTWSKAAATLTTSLDLGIKRKTRSSMQSLSVDTSGNLPACTTPVNCVTPVKDASPICMGKEYLKQSCNKRCFLMKELNSLLPHRAESITPVKDTRKRRDTSMIHVVFSRHLDGDIVKQQKKILSRLGASEAPSMSDATHFVADEFVRTRNMLEAIALGKPVVTHLWLESCGRACCHIDEKNFLLRDAKKEKEFGFSLPASLAHARRNPLLQGHRVLITPNTKPGKEILTSLAKAVGGVVVEKIGRTSLKDNKIPDGLLVVSCEEDYELCLPFLEKGATVYSSELLLDGIVTQKLEYERHSLFLDQVKRTRSTLWVKKDDNRFKPVAAKCK